MPVVLLGALEATEVSVSSETRSASPRPRARGPASDIHVLSASDPENEALLPAAFQLRGAAHARPGGARARRHCGGNAVTVRGTGFGEGTTVTFGGEPARDVQVVDAHTLTCRTPSAREWARWRSPSTRGSSRAALAEGFTFFDPRGPGGLSGAPFTGTLNVTVLDSSFGA